MIDKMPYFTVSILMLVALVGVLTQRNLIKLTISIGIFGSAVNLFLVTLGYRTGGAVPIHYLAGSNELMVLPTPQCLTLTAIVIALATEALMLSLVILIHRHYGSINIDEIRRLRG
jgi:multicomponent Na+:H+ antiporter subunit C